MHVTQVGSAPAAFCIRLSPTDAEDMVHKGARITMAVQYCRRYPRAAPTISFSEPENMEPEHVEELEETVKARVRTHPEGGRDHAGELAATNSCAACSLGQRRALAPALVV